jgi:hypothetical protein
VTYDILSREIMVSSQFGSKLLLRVALGKGNDVESGLGGELDGEMSQASDTFPSGRTSVRAGSGINL